MSSEAQSAAAEFDGLRRRLCAAAYAVTGSLADAEDVVQDAWFRWAAVDRSTIGDPTGWLVTVVSRMAIDRLRSAQHRREVHVGPWLPEPVVGPVDPADVVSEAEQVSLAFLTALERLGVDDRIVLVLRDVADLDYAAISELVGRSPAACRKSVERARARVTEPQRRRPVDPAMVEGLFASLMAALAHDDLDAVTEILASDVTLVSDGGATRRAARRAVLGPDRVARFLLGINRHRHPDDELSVLTVNGDPGIALVRDGVLHTVLSASVDGERGEIVAFHAVLDPPKLHRAAAALGLDSAAGPLSSDASPA